VSSCDARAARCGVRHTRSVPRGQTPGRPKPTRAGCAHTHARTHARTRTHAPARKHARTHARMHTHARTHPHVSTHARTHMHTHTHTRARTHEHAHTHTRTHARIRADAHAHTHTHTHTHAGSSRAGWGSHRRTVRRTHASADRSRRQTGADEECVRACKRLVGCVTAGARPARCLRGVAAPASERARRALLSAFSDVGLGSRSHVPGRGCERLALPNLRRASAC
jgi:hypothetical protein